MDGTLSPERFAKEHARAQADDPRQIEELMALPASAVTHE
jgi:hypothetical protein